MTPEREARIKKGFKLQAGGPGSSDGKIVHDPHNISAVMRTCDAVGVQDVYILNTAISRHHKFGKKKLCQRHGVAHHPPVRQYLRLHGSHKKNGTVKYTPHTWAHNPNLFTICTWRKTLPWFLVMKHAGHYRGVPCVLRWQLHHPTGGAWCSRLIFLWPVPLLCTRPYRQRQLAGCYNGGAHLARE